MKIIDILNKKANGTLEDGFKFCFRDEVFAYNKELDRIHKGDNILNRQLGEAYKIEGCLNDEILLFQEEAKESEKRETEKNKKIIEETRRISYNFDKTNYTPSEISYNFKKIVEMLNIQGDKINELVRAVNKLIKEREDK